MTVPCTETGSMWRVKRSVQCSESSVGWLTTLISKVYCIWPHCLSTFTDEATFRYVITVHNNFCIISKALSPTLSADCHNFHNSKRLQQYLRRLHHEIKVFWGGTCILSHCVKPEGLSPHSQEPATCPSHTFWRFILILSSHLSGLLASGFRTKTPRNYSAPWN
jgi:hypothetical protein